MQASQSILMVRPVDFEFNTETATDNEFQNQASGENVKDRALKEFQGAVDILRSEGVNVLVLEKDDRLEKMPDAVFPNNWFASDSEGVLHVFPMKAANRRAEAAQLHPAISLLENAGFICRRIQDWREKLGSGMVLEGTGSLIFDRAHQRFFASVSERTQEEACRKFADASGLEAILFHTKSSKGAAYYHTNVVMSIGPELIVCCLECIPDEEERQSIRKELLKYHKLLEISIYQLEKGFCGNLLQVLNTKGEVLTILSETAFQTFSAIQKQELARFGKLVPIPIPLIEKVGGGSIRCMMAEIFCPRKPE